MMQGFRDMFASLTTTLDERLGKIEKSVEEIDAKAETAMQKADKTTVVGTPFANDESLMAGSEERRRDGLEKSSGESVWDGSSLDNIAG